MVLEVSTVKTLEEVKIGRDCKGAFGVAGKFYFFNQCVDYVSRFSLFRFIKQLQL